ncbi:MAG: glycosyltransferase family 4 protein [Chloroflexota bacterium]
MKRKYKIAMVAACPFPYPRGTPTRIYRMAEALVRYGHQVNVITYHLGELEKDAPFRIHRIPKVKSYNKLTPGPSYQKLLLLDGLLLAKLYRILNRYDFDLIHAHHYESLLISKAISMLTKHKVVYDAHTALESELPYYAELGLTKQVKQRVGGTIDSRLPQKADHIITVTDDLKQKLLQHFPLRSEKISVIPTGVEFDFFASVPPVLQPSHGPKTLIFTGNLAAYQGIDLMLKALSYVIDKRQDVCLKIVSNDSLEPYQPLIDQLEIGHYIEHVPSDYDELPHELANATLAMNPRTECDGLPQKLLNYMAAGAPVVSFAGSAKQIVHSKQGWIAPNDDTQAFANGILHLLDKPNLAIQIGQNAQRHALETFSWPRLVQKIERIYGHVLSS